MNNNEEKKIHPLSSTMDPEEVSKNTGTGEGKEVETVELDNTQSTEATADVETSTDECVANLDLMADLYASCNRQIQKLIDGTDEPSEKKYELIPEPGTEKQTYSGKKLCNPMYRIRALKTIFTSKGTVNKGDLGGLVESEKNLSQTDNSWIDYNSQVIGNARVSGKTFLTNTSAYGNARVRGGIFSDCIISGKAHVSVFSAYDSIFLDQCKVTGGFIIDKSTFSDRVKICTTYYMDRIDLYCLGINSVLALLSDITYSNFKSRTNIQFEPHSYINECTFSLNKKLVCNAPLYLINKMLINEIHLVDENRRSEDIIEQLILQCDLVPEPGDKSVIAYKIVKDDGRSLYTDSFKYDLTPGSVIEEENPDMNIETCCGEGLHFSGPSFFDKSVDKFKSKLRLLTCRVMIDDIITVNAGKFRCTKATVLASRPLNKPRNEFSYNENGGCPMTEIYVDNGTAYIPRNVTHLPQSRISGNKVVFENHSKLQVIEDSRFDDDVTEVILPEDTYTHEPRIEIQDMAFSFTSISEIVIPKSVKTIYDGAFAKCESLERFIIKDRDGFEPLEFKCTYNEDNYDVSTPFCLYDGLDTDIPNMTLVMYDTVDPDPMSTVSDDMDEIKPLPGSNPGKCHTICSDYKRIPLKAVTAPTEEQRQYIINSVLYANICPLFTIFMDSVIEDSGNQYSMYCMDLRRYVSDTLHFDDEFMSMIILTCVLVLYKELSGDLSSKVKDDKMFKYIKDKLITIDHKMTDKYREVYDAAVDIFQNKKFLTNYLTYFQQEEMYKLLVQYQYK